MWSSVVVYAHFRVASDDMSGTGASSNDECVTVTRQLNHLLQIIALQYNISTVKLQLNPQMKANLPRIDSWHEIRNPAHIRNCRLPI